MSRCVCEVRTFVLAQIFGAKIDNPSDSTAGDDEVIELADFLEGPCDRLHIREIYDSTIDTSLGRLRLQSRLCEQPCNRRINLGFRGRGDENMFRTIEEGS